MKKIYILLFMTLCTLCASAAVETLADGTYTGTYRMNAIFADYSQTNKTIIVTTDEGGATKTIVVKDWKSTTSSNVTSAEAVDLTIKLNVADNSCTIEAQSSGISHKTYNAEPLKIASYTNYNKSLYHPETGIIELGVKYTGAKSTAPTTFYRLYDGIDYLYLNTDNWSVWEAYPAEKANTATWNFSSSNYYWKGKSPIKNSNPKLFVRSSKVDESKKQIKIEKFNLGIDKAVSSDLIMDWDTDDNTLTLAEQYIGYQGSYVSTSNSKTYTYTTKIRGTGTISKEKMNLTLNYTATNNTSDGVAWKASVSEIVDMPSFDLAVSSAGWASMYIDYPVLVPEGATAYYASSISSSSIHLTPIEAGSVIPVKTGVIVSASEGTHKFVASAETPVEVTGNLFKGVLGEGDVSKVVIYVLSPASTPLKPVFSKYTSETLAPNKVYLFESQIPSSGKFEFVFDEPTGIETVNNTPFINNTIYNLQGMKVDNNYKGVIVVNGKKFVNK